MEVSETLKAAPKGFLDDLLEATEIKSQSFDVELHGGRKLTFKVISQYNDLQSLKNKADMFVRATRTKGLVPQQFQEFWIQDPEARAMCKVLSETILEPQMGDFEFMKLAFLRPLMFEHIKTEYNAGHQVKELESENEEIQAAKKE